MMMYKIPSFYISSNYASLNHTMLHYFKYFFTLFYTYLTQTVFATHSLRFRCCICTAGGHEGHSNMQTSEWDKAVFGSRSVL